jgi:hypothetical protein
MRWDDRTYCGERDEWKWFVSRPQIQGLLELVLSEHFGARLWICTFDSGTISPDEDERLAGWSVVDGMMVSPPLHEGLDVPCDQYDEWYIFEDASSRIREFDRFVNYGGFNLADPKRMAESFDPSWERGGLDYLNPLQEGFWAQIDVLRPISYVGSGDNDVVVTRKPSFAAKLRECVI